MPDTLAPCAANCSCSLGARPDKAAHALCARCERNELQPMSTQSVDTDRSTMVAVEDEPTLANHADVVVKGRNVEVPEHFRIYVSEKLARLERFDRTIYLFDVELDHERNRRQRKNCQHVEITARGRGPVVRGEALRRQLLCRAGVRRRQAGEPAATQQGPPQDPLRRQDAGRRWPRRPPSCRFRNRHSDGQTTRRIRRRPRARPDRAGQGAPGHRR